MLSQTILLHIIKYYFCSEPPLHTLCPCCPDLAQRLASCSLSVLSPVAQTVTSAPLTTTAEEEESPAEGGMEPDTRARTPATPPAVMRRYFYCSLQKGNEYGETLKL